MRRIALGGMAEIFEAVDERSGRTVALKKILPQVATDPDFLDRFFHEIRIQISLKHPNVVELLDCSATPGRAYIVMEYVDGGELHALRRASGRFPWEIALFATSEALSGLEAAHARGVIHRDVKPQNLMWTREGRVKIGDFGISHAAHLTRLTQTGVVVGTPAHMSPEQARGEELDARTDLFSLGTVLYELLCGYNPFSADSIAVSLRRVAEIDPDLPSLLDPSIPPSVDSFLRKLHAKDRERRFASARAASKALTALLAGEGVEAPAARFRTFLEDPAAFVADRNQRLARESSAAAERLLKDRSAPPAEALWQAYRTVACTPDDPAAQTLLRTAALRAGQREKPLDNARIRELEEALKKDPDNLALLLQLAKLYRLEHDVLNLMRFFRKLQALSPPDAYTQGQISSLLSPETPPSAAPRRAPPSRADAPGRARALAAAAAVLLLAALGAWWAKQAPRLPSGERRAARASAPAPAPAAAPARAGTGGESSLERTLERGALVERESGAAAALDLYEDAVRRTAREESRAVLLTAIADLAVRAQDRPRGARARRAARDSGRASRGPSPKGRPPRRALAGRRGGTVVRGGGARAGRGRERPGHAPAGARRRAGAGRRAGDHALRGDPPQGARLGARGRGAARPRGALSRRRAPLGRAAPLRGRPEGRTARERPPQGGRGGPQGARGRAPAGGAAVKSHRKVLALRVPGRIGFVNITREVQLAVDESGVQEGLCLVNPMHITASVFINDDEPGLHRDYERFFETLVPHEPLRQWRHNDTGEDNADAHVKRQLMGREVVVAITKGRLDFGTWERIFYGEWDGRREKRVLIKIIGE